MGWEPEIGKRCEVVTALVNHGVPYWESMAFDFFPMGLDSRVESDVILVRD
jgi:hypothetical protein